MGKGGGGRRDFVTWKGEMVFGGRNVIGVHDQHHYRHSSGPGATAHAIGIFA